MTIQFAIGYLKGGMLALGVGAFGAFLLGIFIHQSKFLWCCLILEFLILPIWAMKNNLEKGIKP